MIGSLRPSASRLARASHTEKRGSQSLNCETEKKVRKCILSPSQLLGATDLFLSKDYEPANRYPAAPTRLDNQDNKYRQRQCCSTNSRKKKRKSVDCNRDARRPKIQSAIQKSPPHRNGNSFGLDYAYRNRFALCIVTVNLCE